MSPHIPCHLFHACKIRSKRNHISNTLHTNTEHWASLREALTAGWCVHPLLWQIVLIHGKTEKHRLHNLEKESQAKKWAKSLTEFFQTS